MFTKRPNSGSDHEAFQKLFDEYYDSIKNYLFYKSGNIEQAEDLTQEVFIIIWDKRHSLKSEKIKSFLYTIATNLFLNQVKHQKVVLKFQKQPFASTSHETPQFLMEETEFKRQLENAISCLPEKARIVFLMNRIEKLTYREIAERLNLSEKTIEKRMTKALKELRKVTEKI
jgi:RNA polymerase sigma-70 factor (ECF subfamily)